MSSRSEVGPVGAACGRQAPRERVTLPYSRVDPTRDWTGRGRRIRKALGDERLVLSIRPRPQRERLEGNSP
jgi:hypothetical protein